MSKTLIVSLGIIVLLVGGYFLMQKQLPKISRTTEKLTVAMVKTSSYALMHIAKNKGYFKEEILDITYNECVTGTACLADALTGNSDISISFETPVVRKIYEGEKLNIISTIHSSTKNTALIARKDKGIMTLDDLKGKKIGVSKNTSFEFFLYSYLLSQGIKLSDVTLVDGDPADMVAMIKDEKVDAVAIGNPYLFDIQKEFSQGSLSIFQSEVYMENSVLAGREDIVINKKEALTRLLRALAKAEEFYKTHNQEALDAVVALLPAISEETIRGTWDKYTPILALNNVLLTLLNREGQWFKDNGIYKTEVPDFRKAIFTDYLKSVKPEAVTLY